MDFKLSYTPVEDIAEIELPGSKSITNRVLIINALSENPTRIEGLAQCDDTFAILDALKSWELGKVDIGASGTAMRFLTAYFATLQGASLTLTGSERMQHRPIAPLVDSLRQLGANINYEGEDGFPPLRIEGRKLKGGHIGIRGDISSQFISALMIIGATLKNGLTIHLLEDTISRPYIDMTTEIMRKFGVDVRANSQVIEIPAQSYLNPISFTVEADWSSASFFYEFAAIAASGNIKLKGLTAPDKSLQGDARLANLYHNFGIGTAFYDDYAVISSEAERHFESTETLRLNMADCPDLVPAMAVTACLTDRHFYFTGTRSLRIKECDRVAALVTEMRKLGYFMRCDADSLSWEGERCEPEENPIICTHNDHRIAMAFAPAVLKYTDLRISDAMVVNKSFPQFWNEMRRLGITTKVI